MTDGQHEAPTKTLLSPAAYDALKKAAQIWLPALAVFYITVAPFWGFPKQEEVAGTIMAFDLLLGVVLGISTKRYYDNGLQYDGEMVVGTDANRVVFNNELENLEDKPVLKLKVTRPDQA